MSDFKSGLFAAYRLPYMTDFDRPIRLSRFRLLDSHIARSRQPHRRSTPVTAAVAVLRKLERRDRGLHAAVGGGALGAALAARRAAREHEGASSGTRSCIVAASAAVRRHLLLLCMRVYASLLQAQPADTHVNAPREQGTDVP